MNLRQLIRDNWEGRAFMKIAANKDYRKEIENKTSFLDSYYGGLKLKQRAFVLLNDITEGQMGVFTVKMGILKWSTSWVLLVKS